MQQYRLSKTLETRQPNHRSIIKCTCTHTQYAYTTRAHMHVYAHSHPHIHTYMHAHATAQHTRTFKNTRTHTGTQTHRHIGRNLKKPGTRFNVDFFKVVCSRNLSYSRTNKHGRGCASQVNTYTARQTQTQIQTQSPFSYTCSLPKQSQNSAKKYRDITSSISRRNTHECKCASKNDLKQRERGWCGCLLSQQQERRSDDAGL